MDNIMSNLFEIEKVLKEMENESVNFWKELDELLNNVNSLETSINDLTIMFINIIKGEKDVN
jgi:hypothetical protein